MPRGRDRAMKTPPQNNKKLPSPSDDAGKIQQELEAAFKEVQGKPDEADIRRIALHVAQRITVSERYEGPLPRPDHLREYEDILPGAAERIFSSSERQLEHNISSARFALEAQVADTRRGKDYGAGLFAFLIVCAFGSLFVTDNPLVPGIFLGAATVGGITALIRGRD